eukprot:10194304-Ditylum_brightwellii.AAC.1
MCCCNSCPHNKVQEIVKSVLQSRAKENGLPEPGKAGKSRIENLRQIMLQIIKAREEDEQSTAFIQESKKL